MSIEDKLYHFLSFYKRMPDWSKRLISAPFKILPRQFYLGREYELFYHEAEMMEYADSQRILEYQFLKLKQLLYHCKETVPYYRKQWTEYDVDLSKIQTVRDFELTIPLLTRDLLQKNPEMFISNIYSKKQILNMNSGGSTGVPLRLYYLKGTSRAAEWSHMNLLWKRVDFKIGNCLATLRGDFIGKNRVYSFDPYRNILMLSSFQLNKNNADLYLDLLTKYKVEFINAYPSSLFNLIQLSNHKFKKIPTLKAIMFGSENIFEWQIKRIKEFFSIEKMMYWYGHSELCVFGGVCEDSSDYHFFPSYGFLELNDETSVSSGYGNLALEIIGTSFINPLMPLIRYKTQDYGVLSSGECKCGRNHLRLSKILGRDQEMAIGFNNEKITLTALVFGRHSEYFNHIKKMQIVNTKPGELIVKIVPSETFSADHEKEIIKNLSRKEDMPFKTRVEIVDIIPSTKTGKHRFLIREFDIEA